MLSTLRIQNFAIVDQLEVSFKGGLNVVTGETGAGKSIMVDALQLILGGRAQADCVRAGADEAVVEALFEGDDLDERLAQLGLPPSGGELLIRRVIARSGRGRVTINGALSTVGLLHQVGKGLVDLSGQHEHVALLDVGTHLGLLDAFAGLVPEAAEYKARYHRFVQAEQALVDASTNETERARKADYLAFQLKELDEVDPKPGEEEQLAHERRRLASAERLRMLCGAASEFVSAGEGGAVEQVGRAVSKLVDAQALDPRLDEVVTGLKAGLAEVEEASRSLARYLSNLHGEPEKLTEVDDRLEAIKRLCRKHGCDSAALRARADAMRKELDALTHHEARLAELQNEVLHARKAALELGASLSKQRRVAAEGFGTAVRAELSRLAMGSTRFEAAFTELKAGELGPAGLDELELLISPNPGEPLKPLAKIASGGELSRVLLAVKRALAQLDPVPSYVFDEVDSGIGGAVAEAVGRMLRDVAKARQLLCITHLPQIACFAEHHLVVRKDVVDGRTVSTVETLRGPEEQQRELARMLAGAEVSAVALEHAAHLLSEGHRDDPRQGANSPMAPVEELAEARKRARGKRAANG
jgi:DNA repair protein RecN (Recombination protein N)